MQRHCFDRLSPRVGFSGECHPVGNCPGQSSGLCRRSGRTRRRAVECVGLALINHSAVMLQRRLVFQAFDASWTSLAVLALVIAAATLVVLLSRYERKLVPAQVGYGLLVLRLCVIAVLWLALLQPV